MHPPAGQSGTGALRVLVLGAAAGGGVPQWNCGCAVCRAAWTDPSLQQGQVSLALSADGGAHWFLVNASPDLRAQILATPALWPAEGKLRHSPIAGVFLTNGEVDAVAGLLSMREGQSFALHAHPRVLDLLAMNPIFNVLDPARVPRIPMTLGEPFEPKLPDGRGSGLLVEPFTVPGKVAWYMEGVAGTARETAGDTLGLTFRPKDGGGPVVHVLTACARIDKTLKDRLAGADMVFFDGTLWTDHEMIALGLAPKTGAQMGHLPMAGPDGAIAGLDGLNIARKIFVHINNSNPAHLPTSPQRRALEAAGWVVPRPQEVFEP